MDGKIGSQALPLIHSPAERAMRKNQTWFGQNVHLRGGPLLLGIALREYVVGRNTQGKPVTRHGIPAQPLPARQPLRPASSRARDRTPPSPRLRSGLLILLACKLQSREDVVDSQSCHPIPTPPPQTSPRVCLTRNRAPQDLLRLQPSLSLTSLLVFQSRSLGS